MDQALTTKEILEILLIPLAIPTYMIILALYTPIALLDQLWGKILRSRYRHIFGGS